MSVATHLAPLPPAALCTGGWLRLPPARLHHGGEARGGDSLSEGCRVVTGGCQGPPSRADQK
eukprot:11904632-Alexandrium_andersonii.AAC.1